MNRRDFLSATVSAALAAAPSRKPNIVFFLYDDLGYANLGCYGGKHMETPFSDQLAREGTRYTDCYAGACVCAPSRSTLMSGLHQGHAPVRANAQTVPLEPSDVTIAKVLKQAGYATGGFGKWGLGDAGTAGSPVRQGFDEFFGYTHQTHAHNYWPEYLRDGDEKVPLPANVGRKKGTYAADVIADRTYRFIDRNKDQPFFLFATPTLPHGLFHPPDDRPYSSKPWTPMQRNYASMVTRADAQLGEILKRLDRYNLTRDTIVFVTSDNGGPELPGKAHEFFQTNGPLRDFKTTLYEGGIRVPMIVRWPGHVPAGRTSSAPWYFADVLPTLCDLSGTTPPKPLDGVSMLRQLEGRGAPKPRFLYWEDDRWSAQTRRLDPSRLRQAVRWGNWKAVRSAPGTPLELYDLAADIGESRNVAADNPKVIQRIETYLASVRTEPRPHDNGNPEWVGRKDIPPGDSH
jgi:arylsulfatase A-like enzyme